MFVVREGTARVRGRCVQTFDRGAFENGVLLNVSAGTNGYKTGKDQEDVSRTYLFFERYWGDIDFKPVHDEDGEIVGVEVNACGSSLNVIVKALSFALKTLEDQRAGVHD